MGVMRRLAPWNAGHLQMQTATCLEKLADLNGLCEVGQRIVVFDDTCFGKTRRLCAKFSSWFVGPLTAYPFITKGRLQRGGKVSIQGHDLSKAGYVCFESAVQGV